MKDKYLTILNRKTSVVLKYKKNKYEINEYSNGYICVDAWDYGVIWRDITSTKIGKKLIRLYRKNKWEKYYK
jgi:hypothetical protein